MKREATVICLLLLSIVFLTSCSYNPFISNNHLTGDPAAGAIGAGVGAGAVALAGGTKPMIAVGGIAGGMFGYYVTTLRHDAGPIIRGGGNVYQVGKLIGIYIPTDNLFEPNTAELLPEANAILDATIVVLERYPNNNIIVSGNTSSFYTSRWEQRLSEKRAQVVAAYLWRGGISQFKFQSNDTRKLLYVGYGDYFPIANYYTDKGIRANSRIQITSYPSDCDLHIDQRTASMRNVGTSDDYVRDYPVKSCDSEANDGSGLCKTNDP